MTIQIVLALIFFSLGILKYMLPMEKVVARFFWARDHTWNTVLLIGAVELLCAIGLIVPSLIGISHVVTRLSALIVCIIMMLAGTYNLRENNWIAFMINAVLLTMATFIIVNGHANPQ